MSQVFTAEQVTYFATLAQVTPVLLVAVALEARFISRLGGRAATLVLMVGLLGEFCALSWLGAAAYPERGLPDWWLGAFGTGAEAGMGLLLVALLIFGFEVLWQLRRTEE